jgi:hypothetical protein
MGVGVGVAVAVGVALDEADALGEALDEALGGEVSLGLDVSLPDGLAVDAAVGVQTRERLLEPRAAKSAAPGTRPRATTVPPDLLMSIETMSPARSETRTYGRSPAKT